MKTKAFSLVLSEVVVLHVGRWFENTAGLAGNSRGNDQPTDSIRPRKAPDRQLVVPLLF